MSEPSYVVPEIQLLVTWWGEQFKKAGGTDDEVAKFKASLEPTLLKETAKVTLWEISLMVNAWHTSPQLVQAMQDSGSMSRLIQHTRSRARPGEVLVAAGYKNPCVDLCPKGLAEDDKLVQ